MKLSLRIWFLAQLLNAVISLLVFREIGLFVTIFAFLGGLPAILMYWFVLMLTQRMVNSASLALFILTIAFACCTAFCALITMAYFGLSHDEGCKFIIAPVLATMFSVLIHAHSIFHFIPTNEE